MDQIYRGLVRDKVLDYIMYNGGESRHYISLVSLQSLLAQICEIDEYPKYIRIPPFYKHSTRSIGIELDAYMCYIESTAEAVTSDGVRAFRESCTDECVFENVMTGLSKSLQKSGVAKDAFVMADKQYHLLNRADVVGFHASLWRYVEYLHFLIPALMKQIKNAYDLSDSDLFLGEFCFEVHCN